MQDQVVIWNRIRSPASQVKKNQAHLLDREPTQLVLRLRLATTYKARAGYAMQPSMTRKPQIQSYTIQVWLFETFIVSASSSSG
jgi:hypothetical protein